MVKTLKLELLLKLSLSPFSNPIVLQKNHVSISGMSKKFLTKDKSKSNLKFLYLLDATLLYEICSLFQNL